MEGTPFGQYRLVEMLGRGGMGDVWRAYDTDTKRTVAIKTLPLHLADDDTFVRRFRREAEAAAQLNNPHIIPIHHYGEIDGRLYVDMRLIEGRDLHEVLASDGPLKPLRAVHIIEQAAQALHAAHAIGLVHRDVKPSNIMVGEDDFVYLIDFGIARGAEDAGLTGTGATIGTWTYMAPERFTRTDIDARSDVYALACVLYQCLTGQLPFPGESLPLQMHAHIYDDPPRPSHHHNGVPHGFDAIIATGMAKDPDDRYQTTLTMARAAHDVVTIPTYFSSDTRISPTRAASSAQQPTTLSGDQTGQQTTPTHARRTIRAPSSDRLKASLAPASTPRRQPTKKAGRNPYAVVLGALAAIAVITAAVIIFVPAQHASPGSTAASPYGDQVKLPFALLNGPLGVAVDFHGTVYVANSVRSEVLKLAAGSSTDQVLPFTGLGDPHGVAVDAVGSVYVTDSTDGRVLKLAAGSSTQQVLPFTGLHSPHGVAVDAVGSVYVTDSTDGRVLKLAAGSSTQQVLPFIGLNGAEAVTVDGTGAVYVTDYWNRRVIKLAAGSSAQEVLPFVDLLNPNGVAVDADGTVYVADSQKNRVVKLAAQSSTPEVVPFSDLRSPGGVAVDAAGTVYVTQAVTSSTDDQVLKLPLN